jgi:predicted porin
MSKWAWTVVALALAVPLAARAGDGDKLTVYGILDVGVAYQNRSTETAGTTNAGEKFGVVAGTVSPIILGVNGSHDIGNGNKVEFQLEGGTNFENGTPGFGMNGPVWGRNANFGAAGSWGSVRAGFELTPFLGDIGDVDTQGLSLAGSALNFYLSALGTTGLFDNRMVQYRSPSLSGFKFSAGVGTGNVPGSTSRGSELQATASYAMSGLNVGAGYLTVNDTTAGAGKAAESFWAGAGYKFEPVTVRAMFHDFKTADGANHTQLFGGGPIWAVTPVVTLKYGYYYYLDSKTSANKTQLHAISATYAVDKSTNVYLGFTLVQNKGANQIEPLAGSSWGGTGAPIEASTSAVYTGAAYSF